MNPLKTPDNKLISAAITPGACVFRGEADSALGISTLLFYIGKTFSKEISQGKMTDFSMLTHSVCQCY